MFIIIDIYSKNFLSLKSFLKVFLNKKTRSKLKLILLKSSLQKTKKKKIFTVLKSPHVNKKAQEQFEHRIYKKRIKCFTFQTFLFLMFLKKIKFYVFSDINIKINIIKNFNNSKKKIKNRLNTDNYKLNFKKLDLTNYLEFFEVYGEFVLKSKL